MTVAGFQVELTADTEVQGALATGAAVRLTGLTQPPDHILAAKIEGLKPASPPLPPTATVEPLVEPADDNSGSGSSSDDNPESESDDDNSGSSSDDDNAGKGSAAAGKDRDDSEDKD